jgi:hypothetical protein
VSLYDSTFSRTVWRLYGGSKGLVMWYYHLQLGQRAARRPRDGDVHRHRGVLRPRARRGGAAAGGWLGLARGAVGRLRAHHRLPHAAGARGCGPEQAFLYIWIVHDTPACSIPQPSMPAFSQYPSAPFCSAGASGGRGRRATRHRARGPACRLAMGDKVMKCRSPLNVLKYTSDHSCY